MTGFSILVASFGAAFAVIISDVSAWWMCAPIALLGFGQSFIWGSNAATTMRDVAPELMGAASACTTPHAKWVRCSALLGVCGAASGGIATSLWVIVAVLAVGLCASLFFRDTLHGGGRGPSGVSWRICALLYLPPAATRTECCYPRGRSHRFQRIWLHRRGLRGRMVGPHGGPPSRSLRRCRDRPYPPARRYHLGTGRLHPDKFKAGLDTIKTNMADAGVDALVAIGGEGTLKGAKWLSDNGIPVIGVPKTIDNDVNATDYTFGFDTAVSVATDAIDRLHTTAESHDRILIVEVMGRHVGWIALHA